MSTKPYPKEEGWIKMDATLTSGKPLSKERIKQVLTHGNQDNYEFGPISQNGRRVRMTLRQKPNHQT